MWRYICQAENAHELGGHLNFFQGRIVRYFPDFLGNSFSQGPLEAFSRIQFWRREL